MIRKRLESAPVANADTAVGLSSPVIDVLVIKLTTVTPSLIVATLGVLLAKAVALIAAVEIPICPVPDLDVKGKPETFKSPEPPDTESVLILI